MLSFISLLLLIIPQTIWAGGYSYAPPKGTYGNDGGKYGGSSNRPKAGRSDRYNGRDDNDDRNKRNDDKGYPVFRGYPDKSYKPYKSKPQPNSDDFDDEDLICPFITEGTPVSGNDPDVPDIDTYNDILESLDEVQFINDVFQDIVDLLTDSQECFPADTLGGQTNYGGLFIRLAWHCAGTFRETDGAGGCAGGRQRFPPEASWMDNVNLDKARALLVPIKEKYGDALSWGDLMVFAGTASIYALNGPVNNICVGRIDEFDGSASDVLGISGRPETADPPCLSQGDCNENGNDIIGASTVGLIYVNPEGVNGDPDPARSAPRIREIFSRMGNNDSETVALIGGGHAFGKCHGACPLGPGPNPEEQPFNPWPGLCGTGRGIDTFTSGIEGQWTTFPFVWDNEYFQLLRDDGFDYELIRGPGGAYQWRNPNNGLLMLTTDLAFIYDDDFYDIVVNYANDLDALDSQFAAVWEKLTTSGGGFAREAFCIDARELDLDLDEIGIVNDYVPGGKRNRKKKGGSKRGRSSSSNRSGNRGKGNRGGRGNDGGSSSSSGGGSSSSSSGGKGKSTGRGGNDGRSSPRGGNYYGKQAQRNDYGAPQRSKPRNDGRNDDKPRVIDDRNRGNDGKKGGSSSSGNKGNKGSSSGKKGGSSSSGSGNRGNGNRGGNDGRSSSSSKGGSSSSGNKGGSSSSGGRQSAPRGGNDGRSGSNGKDGYSTKSYSNSYGGYKGKYGAQNEPDNVMTDNKPSSESYFNDYTSFILIGIITLVFNLVAYSLTYVCCLKANNPSKPVANKWIN